MSEQQPTTPLDPSDPDPGEVEDDPRDEQELAGLPPGADTKGDPHSTLRGNEREAAPYEEAPAEGRLAPGAHNPPP